MASGCGKIEQKIKRDRELMDMDNSVVTAVRGGGRRDMKEDKGGINGDGQRLDLWW